MTTISRFLSGESPDSFCRNIEQFYGYSHFWLEHDHKYIQVLFPIDEGTQFNRHAPLVSAADRALFANSETLRQHHLRALDFILGFWGLARRGVQIYSPTPPNPASHPWLKRQNHNQLRMTRVIRSLSLLGNQQIAENLAQFVIETAKQFDSVSEQTQHYWRSALTRPPIEPPG